MSKIYSDTEKWDKPWFRKLPLKYKALWEYLRDRSNHAGIWPVDLELAGMYIAKDPDLFDMAECLEVMEKQIIQFNDNEKWFITDYTFWQQNSRIHELNPNDKVQASILREISKYPDLVNILVDQHFITFESFVHKLEYIEAKWKSVKVPFLRGSDDSSKGHVMGHKSAVDKRDSSDSFKGQARGKDTPIVKDKEKAKEKSLKDNRSSLDQSSKSKSKNDFEKPSPDEMIQYFKEKEYLDPEIEGQRCWNYYEQRDWTTGRKDKEMKNWKLAASNWNLNNLKRERERSKSESIDDSKINQQKWSE